MSTDAAKVVPIMGSLGTSKGHTGLSGQANRVDQQEFSTNVSELRLTENQKRFYFYIKEAFFFVGKYADLENLTGVKASTLKNIVKLFDEKGIIVRISHHGIGVEIKFKSEHPDFKNIDAGAGCATDQLGCSPSYNKIDRKKNHSISSDLVLKNLQLLSNNDIKESWPEMYQLGFRQRNLRYALMAIEREGGDFDYGDIFETFRRVEFEIEHSVHLDKYGRVYGPEYIQKGLLNGLWREPVDYISPHAKKLAELRENERIVSEIRKKEEAQGKPQFDKWYDALTDEERRRYKKQAVELGVEFGVTRRMLWVYWQARVRK